MENVIMMFNIMSLMHAQTLFLQCAILRSQE